jgi:hypothetical protein
LNTETYTYLLAHPHHAGREHLSPLASVIDTYPYFQSARALQLKILKSHDSFRYNDALKKTAAYTTDRDVLFDFITSESFAQNEIAQHIQQHDASVNDIEVEAENVSQQTAQEIDRQLKAELKKAEAILSPELFQRKAESVASLAQPTSGDGSDQKKLVSEEKEKTRNPEEALGIDEPLAFQKNDTHSFSEWLKLTRAKPIDRGATEPSEQEHQQDDEAKQRKFELIERFIQEKPKIQPQEPIGQREDLAKPFLQTPEALMTETLAKVYLQQKNYKKAIQAYKILILKNPEKSGFFADQIRAIEKIINTEQ